MSAAPGRSVLMACALLGIGSGITAVVFLAIDGFKPTTRSLLAGAVAFTFIAALKMLGRRARSAPPSPR